MNVSSVQSRNPERVILGSALVIPHYYVSVASQDLKKRQARWQRERGMTRERPQVRPWIAPGPLQTSASRVLHIGPDATVLADVPHAFAHGLLAHPQGILVAGHHDILQCTHQMEPTRPFASHTALNDVHTIRRTTRGVLVASSGTDTLVELSEDGSTVLWEWWAHEHGFETDHFGESRILNKWDDHRQYLYPTWLHAAHVNSAIELADGSVAATFFMQGMVVRIDRATGKVGTLSEGLLRPHALRNVPNGTITYADTARGIAHLVANDFTPLQQVHVDTNWLQDCQLHDGIWILVDAQHARVYFADEAGNVFAYDQFDDHWDFFEVAVVPR